MEISIEDRSLFFTLNTARAKINRKIVSFYIIYERAVILLLSLGTCFGSNGATIEGQINVPSQELDPASWLAHTKVQIDGGIYQGLVYQNGSFFVRALPVGSSYLVEVLHPQYIFPPCRVDVNSKGKLRARQVNFLKPAEVIPLSHTPLVFNTMGKAQFFVPREQLRTLDMLMNPTILIMLVLFALVFILPRMIDTDDPEVQQMMSGSQNMPTSISDVMSSLLNPQAFDQRGTTRGSSNGGRSSQGNYNRVNPANPRDFADRRPVRR
ncbi:ER membrane protein complex subunit 7 [Cichlidogyrus casuarinus]|uniref:ER membrane protein complex subunit 7 n=1 Tax=Cichlidogyrus casuarinus TaxID=1844966 RepID=A0ABD2QGI2_9PLAT